MVPRIDAAKKLADLLNTIVGYLLGENEDADILKEPKMLERLKTINAFSEQEENSRFILRWMLLYMKLKTEKFTLNNLYNGYNADTTYQPKSRRAFA